jgi:hypothetical protein
MTHADVSRPAAPIRERQSIWLWVLLISLFAIRLPSLAQPMGLDQSVYSYVGLRMLEGDLPYRDVWDHKPVGLHAAYAAMWYLWPDEAVVPLADLLAAAVTALLLLRMAPRFTRSRLSGPLAAGLFLLLGNPAFARYGGVRVRSQAETFVAVLVAASVFAALRVTGKADHPAPAARRAWLVLAGALVGGAALMKYQTAIFLAVPWACAVGLGRDGRPQWSGIAAAAEAAALVFAGFLISILAVLGVYAFQGALPSLWDATVRFNVGYATESYANAWQAVHYLLTFPVRQARVDGLWLVGGAGALVLVCQIVRRPQYAFVLGWIAVACLSIAMNGSRGLPQYFIQAGPALGLAAGIAAADLAALRRTWLNVGLAVLTVWAVARVVSIPDAAAATSWDARRLLGRTDRTAYLGRFAGRAGDKYSPPDSYDLAAHLEANALPQDTVYVFGFSAAAYVYSGRRSASRQFFIAPVVSQAAREWPGYGPGALLDDLAANRPKIVALQLNDAGAGPLDSRGWFLSQAGLATWLKQRYRLTETLNRFEVWERRD